MSRPLPGSTEPQEVDAEQIFADVFEEIPEDTKLRVFEPRGACNAGILAFDFTFERERERDRELLLFPIFLADTNVYITLSNKLF